MSENESEKTVYLPKNRSFFQAWEGIYSLEYLYLFFVHSPEYIDLQIGIFN